MFWFILFPGMDSRDMQFLVQWNNIWTYKLLWCHICCLEKHIRFKRRRKFRNKSIFRRVIISWLNLCFITYFWSSCRSVRDSEDCIYRRSYCYNRRISLVLFYWSRESIYQIFLSIWTFYDFKHLSLLIFISQWFQFGGLCLTFSVMLGAGSSLVYTPSVVILGHYFSKYLGIVNGFVTTGSSIFAVGLPHLFKAMFKEIGVSIICYLEYTMSKIAR